MALPSLVDVLRDAGLDASPVAASVTDVPVTDYLADGDTERLRSGQVDLMERGKYDGPDLARAIEEHRPDVVLVDVNAYGAKVVAEASGLPWAMLVPSVIPLKGAGIPPYGPGLAPMRGPLGWLRDLAHVEGRGAGFRQGDAARDEPAPRRGRPGGVLLPAGAVRRAGHVIALTAEPLEYPRTDLPEPRPPRRHPALGPARGPPGVPRRAG